MIISVLMKPLRIILLIYDVGYIMRNIIFIFISVMSINAYSQLPGLDYKTFINAYIDSTGMYNNIPKETLDILTSSE